MTPNPGDIWVSTVAHARRRRVKVLKVTDHAVHFKSVSRGTDDKVVAVPHPVFRTCYAPTGDNVLKQDTGGRPKKLTNQTAREVWLLAHNGTPYQEIAHAYGIHSTLVSKVFRGVEWTEATAELRANPPITALESVANLFAAPSQNIVHAPAQTTTEEHVSDEDNRIEMPTAPSCGTHVVLITDLADALETLCLYAGKPLRKYVMLDLNAVRTLISDAREAVK